MTCIGLLTGNPYHSFRGGLPPTTNALSDGFIFFRRRSSLFHLLPGLVLRFCSRL
jgi:hypothetical protein